MPGVPGCVQRQAVLQKRVRNFADVGMFDAQDSVDEEDHWLLRQVGAPACVGRCAEGTVEEE
jgi:hypothetical protein